MAENYPNLIKDVNINMAKSQCTPKMNSEERTMLMLSKDKDKREHWKLQDREDNHIEDSKQDYEISH